MKTRTTSLSIDKIVNDPTLRAVYLAGRRAGWKERHDVASAERRGDIESLTVDAGGAPPPRSSASDVRELFDLVVEG